MTEEFTFRKSLPKNKKRKCPLRDCRSIDVFVDLKTGEGICFTCGYYWSWRMMNEKKDSNQVN